jgi:2-polyprenyl-3-methyl-5-hydroxy-6-metoxy-1,4-benzoquinol methylase
MRMVQEKIENSIKATDFVINDLEIMSKALNYKKWIYSKFYKYIGKRIIEIGAGIGNFTEFLIDRELVIAVDNYAPCIEYLQRRFLDYNNIIPLKADISHPDVLMLSKYLPDTIICINVLEHIKDDVAALSHMRNILNSEGKLLLLVPSHSRLYGSYDHVIGHYRRYSKKDLKKKLILTGFYIEDIFYMNSIATLGWLFNYKLLKLKKHYVNQVLYYDRLVIPWLRAIETIIRPPFGLSLVAIAEKR